MKCGATGCPDSYSAPPACTGSGAYSLVTASACLCQSPAVPIQVAQLDEDYDGGPGNACSASRRCALGLACENGYCQDELAPKAVLVVSVKT